MTLPSILTGLRLPPPPKHEAFDSLGELAEVLLDFKDFMTFRDIVSHAILFDHQESCQLFIRDENYLLLVELSNGKNVRMIWDFGEIDLYEY